MSHQCLYCGANECEDVAEAIIGPLKGGGYQSAQESVMYCNECGQVAKSICTYWSDHDHQGYVWIKVGESLELKYRDGTESVLHTFPESEAALWRGLKIEKIAAGFAYGWLGKNLPCGVSKSEKNSTWVQRIVDAVKKKLGAA